MWVILFIVSVPLALGLVPPNRLYGFRIPSTLANAETWRRGNIFAGWVFIAGAFIGGGITHYFPQVAETWGSYCSWASYFCVQVSRFCM